MARRGKFQNVAGRIVEIEAASSRRKAYLTGDWHIAGFKVLSPTIIVTDRNVKRQMRGAVAAVPGYCPAVHLVILFALSPAGTRAEAARFPLRRRASFRFPRSAAIAVRWCKRRGSPRGQIGIEGLTHANAPYRRCLGHLVTLSLVYNRLVAHVIEWQEPAGHRTRCSVVVTRS